MMNTFKHTIILYFIFFEFIVVALFVILTLILKLYFNNKEKKDTDKKEDIRMILHQIIDLNASTILPFNTRVDLIIPIFSEFDKKYPDSDIWQERRKSIMKIQILPHARKYIRRKSWTKRNLLVECYRYYLDPSLDEANIIFLVNDNVPLVSLNAVGAAMSFPSAAIIHAVLKKIVEAPRSLKPVYISQLKSSKELWHVIKEQLKKNHDIYTRIICYDIIAAFEFTDHEFDSLAQHDISSIELELKLAAIRALSLSKDKEVNHLLIRLLKNPDWQVRNMVIKCAHTLHEPEFIDYVAEALNDPSWWVRINAAKVLPKFGEKGFQILRSYGYSKDSYSYQEAEYFFKIREIKESNKNVTEDH